MRQAKSTSKLDRPEQLYFNRHHTYTCDENVNFTFKSSSSEDENSPTTEMNCKKVIDKPTLVKRLTMGLLRMNEETRPLVTQRSSPSSPSRRNNYFYHYINAGIYDVDQKFGDSCRDSLTSVRHHDVETTKSTIEFDFKKNLIRETSSANCSPKKFLISSLKRTDSLNANHMDDDVEDMELKEASWYHSGMPQDISLEVLAQQNPGAFMVRKSTNKAGCFALSVRVPAPGPKVAHYLIHRTMRGYKIKGFPKEFSSLRALITHHSVMPELLPIPLALPRPEHIPRKCNIDDYDTYSTLKDLRSIFSDLDVNT